MTVTAINCKKPFAKSSTKKAMPQNELTFLRIPNFLAESKKGPQKWALYCISEKLC